MFSGICNMVVVPTPWVMGSDILRMEDANVSFTVKLMTIKR